MQGHTPTGNRTPVFWLRTRCPRPLDDGGLNPTHIVPQHARQDSNLQPPVLETGALPIELRASVSVVRPVLPSGQGQNRTADTTIFSRVLYQLSYLAACLLTSVFPRHRKKTRVGNAARV